MLKVKEFYMKFNELTDAYGQMPSSFTRINFIYYSQIYKSAWTPDSHQQNLKTYKKMIGEHNANVHLWVVNTNEDIKFCLLFMEKKMI